MSEGRETDRDTPHRSDGSVTIGDRLKAARAERHLTAETVAHKLRLDVTTIAALENNDTAHLPAPIYVQGYLRSYARLLELPEDELVDAYIRESGELPPLTVNRITSGKAGMRLPSMRMLRNIILVLLAVILLWLAFPFVEQMWQSRQQPDELQSPGHLEIPPAVN